MKTVLGSTLVPTHPRALRGPLDSPGLARLFAADNVWGIAALLWLATGLARAFGGLEKGTDFYLASPLFWLKMTLFVAAGVLEAWPMATFSRWRRAVRRSEVPDTRAARRLYMISHAQMGLVVVIVFVAGFMARGIELR